MLNCFCLDLRIALLLCTGGACNHSVIHSASRTKPPARSVCVCLGVCASVCLVCLPVLFGQDTRKNTRTMSIVCLGRSGCLSVCLPAWLAGCLAGWLVCLSVSVGLSVSVCLSVSVSVCLGLDLSGSVSVCLCLSGSVWVCLSVSVCLCLCLCVKNHMRSFPPKKHQKPHAQYHSPHPVGLGTRPNTEHIHDINRTVSRGLPRRLRCLRCPPNTSTISIVQYPTVCLDVCAFCDVRNALSPGRHNRHRISIAQRPSASRDVCDVNYAIWPDRHNRHHQRLVQF